jgi:hypothetical protein
MHPFWQLGTRADVFSDEDPKWELHMAFPRRRDAEVYRNAHLYL